MINNSNQMQKEYFLVIVSAATHTYFAAGLDGEEDVGEEGLGAEGAVEGCDSGQEGPEHHQDVDVPEASQTAVLLIKKR